MIKLIYIAGRFSAPTREGVEVNIRAAVQRGLDVARLGAYPVTPHANTAHPDFEQAQPYAFWIEGTMRQMLSCDAVLTVVGWEGSPGSRGEVEGAHRAGIPVFHDLVDLREWLQS